MQKLLIKIACIIAIFLAAAVSHSVYAASSALSLPDKIAEKKVVPAPVASPFEITAIDCHSNYYNGKMSIYWIGNIQNRTGSGAYRKVTVYFLNEKGEEKFKVVSRHFLPPGTWRFHQSYLLDMAPENVPICLAII